MPAMAATSVALLVWVTLLPSSLAGAGPHSTKKQPDMGHIWKHTDDCSAHLSDGPADADVQVHLAGLTPSTAERKAYLHWWSPRRSVSVYDPLAGPVNCSVYSSMVQAYAQYDAADFNGGNVLVSESGEAVIRFRSPATYFVWKWTATPHVHLRICNGEEAGRHGGHGGHGHGHHGKHHKFRPGKQSLMLAEQGPWISSKDNQMRVVEAKPYAGRDASAVPVSTAGSSPIGIIAGVDCRDRCSRNSIALVEQPTTTTLSAERRSVMIESAREALNLDALEFSPVYSCLLQEEFFDQFTDGCVDTCRSGATIARGQCVRPTLEVRAANVSASWKLSMQADDSAWQQAKNVSLHTLRLSIAGLLDIPFQEVEVTVGFADAAAARRLVDVPWRETHVQATVNTQRMTAGQADRLLRQFGQDADTMSEILGFPVSFTATASAPPPRDRLRNASTMGQSSDPYDPAYSAAEEKPRSGNPVMPGQTVFDTLPFEAILGICAAILILALVFVGALLIKRRRARAAQAASANKEVGNNKVEEDNNKANMDEDNYQQQTVP